MKTTILFLICICMVLIVNLQPSTISAQVINNVCSRFDNSFGYRFRDRFTGGDIYRMQTLLISLGYLHSSNATGYFGSLTLNAVRRFQTANGIPATGYVAILTRTALARHGCGIGHIPPVDTVTAPTITSISPTSGPSGTIVTIYGNNFSRVSSNSINFANVSPMITGVRSNDGRSLQFVIPNSPCPQGSYVCPLIAFGSGQFPISVTTPLGTSNTVNFILTDGGRAPVINSVDGPTTLTVGQSGTWSVRASDPTYGSYLSYSVVWGDEYQVNSGSYTAAPSISSQTATFNHTYYIAGTYTVIFTVRNNNGVQSESKITVQVTGNNSGSFGVPAIYSLSPTSGYWGTSVTVTGTNFTRYDNMVNFAGVGRAYVGIPSYDGRTLQFTPTATPCSPQNFCAQVALQNGDYQVSVTNQYGTSNSQTYRVTNVYSGDQTQTLQLNQTGYFSEGIRITPSVVSEDSRCPVDVTCIQAGKVTVVASIVEDGTSGSRSFSLSTNGDTFLTNNGYRVQIASVAPSRYSNQGISSDQYRITYRVWR